MNTLMRISSCALISFSIILLSHRAEAEGTRLSITTLVTSDDPLLSSISSNVSINDRGEIGFAGRDANGISEVFFWSPTMGVQNISMFGDSSRTFSGVGINNAVPAEIVARIVVTGTSTAVIRRFKVDGSGGATVGGPALINGGPSWRTATSDVDINDQGEVAVRGLTAGFASALYLGMDRDVAQPSIVAAFLGPPNAFFQPQISNSASTVIRDPNDQVVVYDRQGNAEVIAGPATGHSNIVEAAGISDDGRAIAFAANFQGQFGVFLSVPNGVGRTILRITPPGLISSVAFLDRIGVSSQEISGPQGFQYVHTVVFHGSDSVSDGVWAREITVDGAGSLQSATQTECVLRVQGIISGVKLYDPVNNLGEIAIWVNFLGGKQAILKASALSPALELVDANTPTFRLRNPPSDVVPDAAILSRDGVPVTGVAADGVSRILIRASIPSQLLSDPATPVNDVIVTVQPDRSLSSPLDIGQLHDPFGDVTSLATTGITVPAHIVKGQDAQYAFVVFQAPIDYSGSNKILDNPVFTVNVVIPNEPGLSIPPVSFEIHRVPVVLVHGLEGFRSDWNLALEDSPLFDVFVADYSPTHSFDFICNRFVVKEAIDTAVRRMRMSSIAVTQADVVGHSMGGLLTRLYMLNRFANPGDPVALCARGLPSMLSTGYIRADNYLMGDIHKFITVNTPHRGSFIGVPFVNANGTPTLLGLTAGLFADAVTGRRTFFGAARDLRPDSLILDVINETPAARAVPSHAIVGESGVHLDKSYYRRSLIIAQSCGLSTVNGFFSGEANDVIVRSSSQRGGLPDPQVKVVFGAGAMHFPIVNEFPNGELNIWLNSMLKARTSDPRFASGGFPQFVSTVDPLPNCVSTPLEFNLQIRSSSVSDRTALALLRGGESLILHVDVPAGKQLASVAVQSSAGEVQIDNQPPFDITMTVPLDFIGVITFQAIGFDGQGGIVTSSIHRRAVVTDANLTSISVVPNPLLLTDLGGAQQLDVSGQFDDGIARDVSPASAGTTYVSLDESVATVSAEGLVAWVGSGSTTIQVSSNGVQETVEVSAVLGSICRPDFTSDGFVGMDDLSVILSEFGGQGQSDLNNDGVVNGRDISYLLNVFGPCP